MARFEKTVFTVDEESLAEQDEYFYDWLHEQGPEKVEEAVTLFARELMDYFDTCNDGIWDCMKAVEYRMGYEEADLYARTHAGMRLSLTDLLEAKGYDGCSIDVRKMADPLPHAYVSGYEFVPGRPLEAWHGDRCGEEG